MGRTRCLPDSTMKFLLCFLCLLLPFLSDGATHLVRREALPSPQRGGGRSISGRPQNRFIFGQAGDAGAAGAALGAATQYFANQIFNPCTRGGTRGGNTKNTNNRIFGGQTLANGALGFAAGFASAALVNSALGNPCGR